MTTMKTSFQFYRRRTPTEPNPYPTFTDVELNTNLILLQYSKPEQNRTLTTVTICGDACPLSCASAEAYKLAQCTGTEPLSSKNLSRTWTQHFGIFPISSLVSALGGVVWSLRIRLCLSDNRTELTLTINGTMNMTMTSSRVGSVTGDNTSSRTWCTCTTRDTSTLQPVILIWWNTFRLHSGWH